MKIYQIYDGESPFLSDYPEIEANTGKEAILKHLKATGRNYKLKRSADNTVLFKAQAFYVKNGNKYLNGNAIWYKKLNKYN